MVAGYIVIIMIMRVVQSFFNKRAVMTIPKGVKPYVSYIMISMTLAAVFGFISVMLTNDFSGINLQAVSIAFFSGLLLAINSICGIKALEGGTIVLNSLFGTAGLIIPCVLGIFLFDEPMSLIQVLCIGILFCSAVLLINSSKGIFDRFSASTLFYLIGNFLSNGLVMVCQKLFGELQPDGNVSMFSFLTFLIPAIVLAVVLLFLPTEPGAERKSLTKILPKKLLGYAVILAGAVFIIQQLVTLLTPLVSSAVLFTFVNGGATVIAAIVGAVVYKEKITAKSALGIILGVIALICIKVFE